MDWMRAAAARTAVLVALAVAALLPGSELGGLGGSRLLLNVPALEDNPRYAGTPTTSDPGAVPRNHSC